MTTPILSTTALSHLACSRLAGAMVSEGGFYRPGYCNENVAALVGRVMTESERQAASVLILTHERAKTPELYWRKCFLLRPVTLREEGIGWNHHTVALWDGGIYDYDYRGRPGTPLKDYAFDMFAEGLARYVVREIPADDYVRKYKTRDMIFGENYPCYALGDYAK